MAMVVAIDGPAGAGKSSVARSVAERCGLMLVDTGAIYRSVAYVGLREGISTDDAKSLADIARALRFRFETASTGNRIFVDDEDVSEAIRAREVALAASSVSRHPPVRDALMDVQRALGKVGAGAVLEGRDIGTVVFPDAHVKVFLTASAEERARRRALELETTGQMAPYDVILDEIRRRDKADMERAVAPLVQAADAVLVDTSYLTEREVVDSIVALVNDARVP
jgi:cytidylate kinase